MFLRIGHRGACGYEPENTLRSFRKALELDVDMIELDVHRCRSGDLVIIHDNRVDRTTNGRGYVSEMELEELRSLDAGKGERIPILREVLDMIGGRVAVNIELKGEGTAKPVFDMVEHYVREQNWSYDDFMVSSFNHYELLEFVEMNSSVRIGALMEGIPLGYAEFAEKLNAYSINISRDFVNKTIINDAHNRGMRIFVYTVNNQNEYDRMTSIGVDGIFTDFPDLFK